ncbi:Geraniol synthase, chloroplastic [Cinnamomum micranthum f. kanehirae]|uniref:Geraniol synthase, chloroplastic n=1 Tax=Cinnamomum micranthum f. kanehirae TaxID=337451 RepID=A0A3S3NWY1_9MAGN|nr:Geraniol synthase, chloroplastic [Cinnamomum micranthum f. kanehirae]
MYMREEGMNSSLLQLAKLHFNNVQTTFQRSLRSVSRWWKDMGLGEQYSSFARDCRLVDSFFWATAMTSEPQFGRCQEAVRKVIQFISTIDDIYDVYGTVDELQLLTNAVDRSAKWYSSGYTPTLEEFLQTSWISVGSLGIQMYAFALLGQGLAPESCDFVEKVSDILPLAGMMDDLKRGEVPKSIQCYMHEAGVTEDVARNHIMVLLRETWKKINKSLVESSHPQAFINCVINLGRVAYCTYKHGDGFSD